MTPYYQDDHVTLYHGRWQDVLAAGVVPTVDAVITDTPYSDRTEKGFRTSADLDRRGLGYDPITMGDAWQLVSVVGDVDGWLCLFGDHISVGWYREAMTEMGRYVFPPLPIVKRGAAPRLCNDGPASQSEWMAVSRPKAKKWMSWGSLPGWYMAMTVRHGHGHVGVSGAKHIGLMHEIVRDYTREGDLILDCSAGSGTTGRAVKDMGRRAILIEQDEATCEIAARRLRPHRAWQQDLFAAEGK